jgi:hypothetical protein
MLSADLPIAQVELNFIKQIIPYASRIFFVFNKIDLLSETDLTTTTDFVKKTIKSKLNIDVGEWFICVSAMTEVGMDVIKNEVVDFLKNEKFFSLSEALEKKLSVLFNTVNEIIDSIKNRLDKELNSAEKTLEDSENNHDENKLLLEKIAHIKKQWENFPFLTPKTDKIKSIYSEISDEKYSHISKRIITSLLSNNPPKSDIFDELQKNYSKKNTEIHEKISAEKKAVREIEEKQKDMREKLTNIQKCISLYTQ